MKQLPLLWTILMLLLGCHIGVQQTAIMPHETEDWTDDNGDWHPSLIDQRKKAHFLYTHNCLSIRYLPPRQVLDEHDYTIRTRSGVFEYACPELNESIWVKENEVQPGSGIIGGGNGTIPFHGAGIPTITDKRNSEPPESTRKGQP